MKKKKIIAIVAAVCVIAVIAAILLPGISSDDQGPTMPVIGPDTGEYISRAEWIEQLGLCFTLNTYDQTAPYYSDVPATHGVFAYVQSCYEWGILRDQQAFEPDQTATRAFVAETAMLALALERNPSIAEKDATALLQLACDEGILADQNTYGVTAEECEEIIRKLKEVYFDYQPEEYANIKLKDHVADYSAAEITWRDETVLVVPADVGEKLYVGAIFLAPGEENGIARKVVSVTTANGKTEVETVTPEIEEVFDELSFSFCGTPTLESIVPLQEGITISPLDEATPVNTAATDAQLVNLSNATPLAMGSKKDPISFSVKVNLTKGSIKPNFGFTDYFSTEASKEYKKLFGQEIPKNAGDIFKKTHTILKYDKNGKPILEKTEEWKGGYEITGELKVKKLYVESTCAKDLNSFSNELHFIVDSSLTIKGELKGSLPVYETKIRGPYGVQIKVVFSLYVDMNGKLTVGAEVEHVTNVTYKNKKFKTTQDTDYEVHADLGADISSGVKGEATVSVLGIDLVDVSAKAGASLDIKATAHQSENTAMICIDGKCYFPVVSVSVGSDSKTVAGKLGIKTTIKLVDKSGALSKSASATLWHYEVTKDGSKNVKKCTWDTYKETVGGSSKPTEPAPTNPPATNPPATEPAPTNPPATNPPATNPPATNPPATEPSATNPPSTNPPASEGLEFALTSLGDAYYVAGLGSCTDTDIVIPNTYNGLAVTQIGKQAFFYSKTTSVVIPDSVTIIGTQAFAHCYELTNVTIPDSVTGLHRGAFLCTGLVELKLPESVTWMSGGAVGVFGMCNNLHSITYGGTIEQWNKADQYVNLSWNSGVTKVLCADGEKTMGDDTSTGLEFTLIYGSTYWGGEYDGNAYSVAIGSCTDADIVIPDTYNNLPVVNIDFDAFKDCTGITSITIPNSVCTISARAFSGCSSLTAITIPDSVTVIGPDAFANCTALTSITLSNNITRIQSGTFGGCEKLTNITIPNGVTTIFEYAFSVCFNLTNVSMPASVTYIGENAFMGCSDLIINYEGTLADLKSVYRARFPNASVDYIKVICSDGWDTLY